MENSVADQKAREYGRKWRIKNKEKAREYGLIWRARNKESIKAYREEYKIKNSEGMRIADRELDFGGNWKNRLDFDGWRCYLCKTDLTKAVPNVHHKDGRGYRAVGKKANNSMDNLISMCASCHHKFHILARRLCRDLMVRKIKEGEC